MKEKKDDLKDFESLYERAEKQIRNKEIKLPKKLKNDFLKFKHLSNNKQLALIQELSKIRNLPRVMNDLIKCKTTSPLDKVPKEILKEIGSYLKTKPGSKDKDMSALVQTSKKMHGLFQSERLGKLEADLLLNVVYGNEEDAEKLVQINPKLLLKPCKVTDFSGRTFNCTAYEYAYWAKDTHMCKMLESYMDPDTKAEMLTRCKIIEQEGLTFTQHKNTSRSKHFDLTRLKEALKKYIEAYKTGAITQNWDPVDRAWMEVGMAQRDLPAHVVQEYCNPDRSFHPLPKFNERILPREFTYHNPNLHANEEWFPLKGTESRCLGIDFALMRGSTKGGAMEGRNRQGIFFFCSIDLAAIEHLDAVRTAELKQLRKDLKPKHDKGCAIS